MAAILEPRLLYLSVVWIIFYVFDLAVPTYYFNILNHSFLLVLRRQDATFTS